MLYLRVDHLGPFIISCHLLVPSDVCITGCNLSHLSFHRVRNSFSLPLLDEMYFMIPNIRGIYLPSTSSVLGG